MSSSAEYQDAIKWMLSTQDETGCVCHVRASYDNAHNPFFSLALRWLRVGAAMEAGTLSVSCGRDGKWDAAFMHGTGFQNVFAAPDPLTAAERAMGVGT